MSPVWTEWTSLVPDLRLTPATLAELLDGGQAFRWHRDAPDAWIGVWASNIVRLRLADDGRLAWSAPLVQAETASRTLARYFGIDSDHAAQVDALPWRSDAHLAVCLTSFPGLRILRQPFGETLLGFLCSATKQIVQIKQMISLLAERHGTRINPALPINRLPTWLEIAALTESDLRACLLGFRARFIHETAQFLAADPAWLDETEALPYPAAKARLCELPGVGEKVADCVLLFGAGRSEAFPVDVWIVKTMARRYGLEGWSPAQIAHFGRAHFGPNAGLAQQYLFSWERSQGRRMPT